MDAVLQQFKEDLKNIPSDDKEMARVYRLVEQLLQQTSTANELLSKIDNFIKINEVYRTESFVDAVKFLRKTLDQKIKENNKSNGNNFEQFWANYQSQLPNASSLKSVAEAAWEAGKSSCSPCPVSQVKTKAEKLTDVYIQLSKDVCTFIEALHNGTHDSCSKKLVTQMCELTIKHCKEELAKFSEAEKELVSESLRGQLKLLCEKAYSDSENFQTRHNN